MERQILYVNTDDFYASAVRLRDPALHGRPLAVGNLTSRGSVFSASYEARAEGIRPGMTLEAARRLCPALELVQADWREYDRLSRGFFSLMAGFSPLVERAAPDEAYLDATGCRRLLGPPDAIAQKVRRELRGRLGLACSIGIGASKLVSRMAAGAAKRDRLLAVFPGYEEPFLAPLPIRRLPGLPAWLAERLERMAVRRLGELARIPDALLVQAFGPAGAELAARARGEDASPVRPRAAPRMLAVERAFDPDLLELEELQAHLYLLVEELGAALRREHLAGRHLALEVRYSDGYRSRRGGYHPRATDLDPLLYETAAGLLAAAHVRRVRVRGLQLAAGRLEAAPLQLSLFPRAAEERLGRLQRALDAVRARYREPRALMLGRSLAALAPDLGVNRAAH